FGLPPARLRPRKNGRGGRTSVPLRATRSRTSISWVLYDHSTWKPVFFVLPAGYGRTAMLPLSHSFRVCVPLISLLTSGYAASRFFRRGAVLMNFRATLNAGGCGAALTCFRPL